jgi:arginine/lysine/ornithine decarboxylase
VLDQSRAPYLEAVVSHLGQNVSSYHVPGHQGGLGAPAELTDLLGSDALRADITEVLGIDDIHRANHQCLEAQRLAAAAFGAEETHFLINGSTSGNQAMLLATTGPGDLVLVPRNAHRSTWGALMLSGATAAVYQPRFDPQLGTFGVPLPDDVVQAIAKHPQATALLLTSPSYYGHAADTRAIVRHAHDAHMLVLADEAWGAHLAFHDGLPTSAVHAGADLIVQSTHKMLPCLTQSAMLHVNGDRVDKARLDLTLRTLLSSSPSALLVASLDAARRHYALHGREILDGLCHLARRLRQQLDRLEGISCRGGELQPPGRVSSWDPTRLVVSALARGHTGYELEACLRHEHRLQIEMPDLFGVLVVLTAGHTEGHLEALVQALRALPWKDRPAALLQTPPSFPNSTLTPRQALFSPAEQVPWKQAAGRRSAQAVTLYPPGIPWLLPGETIHPDVLPALRGRKEAGGKVQGAADPTLDTVRVLV